MTKKQKFVSTLLASTLVAFGSSVSATETSSEEPSENSNPGQSEPTRDPHRMDSGILPIVNYDSDIGTGYGANIGLFFRAPGFYPYRYAVRAQGYATDGGVQKHFLRFDAPNFLGSAYRPYISLRFFRDKFRPFYGVGNTTQVPAAGDAIWETNYYAYDFTSFQSEFSLERTLSGPYKSALSYGFRTMDIEPYSNSLLLEKQPKGHQGGNLGELGLEFSYDTRDAESSPTWYWQLDWPPMSPPTTYPWLTCRPLAWAAQTLKAWGERPPSEA